jgi:hypothetical protein
MVTEKRKKAYRKPEIKRVKLVPEEAVLGGCKTSGELGPDGLGCGIGSSPCSLSGS